MKLSSLLSIEDLTNESIDAVLKRALRFEDETQELPSSLAGRTLAHLFFESSTRTHLSFDQAIKKLGGQAFSLKSASSSLKKGESLLDTAWTLKELGAEGLIVRHSSSGVPFLLQKKVGLPVVNAGDGMHEHPTQALTDAYTLWKECGSLAGKTLLIIGDIHHSRVARSNIKLFQKLGANVLLAGPSSLLPSRESIWNCEHFFNLNDALPKADFVMLLRIQAERQNQNAFPSLREYYQFWGLTLEKLSFLKSSAKILHPGPVNQGVELDSRLMNSPQSLIRTQVRNGVPVRMACLSMMFSEDEHE